MSAHDRLSLQQTAGPVLQALGQVESLLGEGPLDPLLRHLVKLRASQVNGCAFCVDMHLREARADGESQARLDRLVVWRQVGDYTPAERAALAWTEALTTRGQGEPLAPLHDELARHFDAAAIAALTAQVVMINGWNRLMAASHNDRF